MSENKSLEESIILANAHQEGRKLVYDAIKHLTTLSTGSILLLVAFLEKFFKEPEWKGLVAASLICFILSTIGSFIAMLVLSSAVKKYGNVDELEVNVGAGAMLFSIISFIIGIICFVVFALKNFY
jgi:hypothetical protein